MEAWPQMNVRHMGLVGKCSGAHSNHDEWPAPPDKPVHALIPKPSTLNAEPYTSLRFLSFLANSCSRVPGSGIRLYIPSSSERSNRGSVWHTRGVEDASFMYNISSLYIAFFKRGACPNNTFFRQVGEKRLKLQVFPTLTPAYLC
jgi:hypothetical protein